MNQLDFAYLFPFGKFILHEKGHHDYKSSSHRRDPTNIICRTFSNRGIKKTQLHLMEHIFLVASGKSTLPYYYHTHMVNFGQWYEQGQTLAHFKDQL